MSQTEVEKKIQLTKSNLFKIIFLILYSLFLFYLYTILIKIESNPIVVILTLIFLFLVVFGLSITGFKKLSQLFHRKKKPNKTIYQKYKQYLQQEIEPAEIEIRDKKNISLEFRYRKPLIRKCSKCGMILTSFTKKCPQCGKKFEL